MTHHIPETSNEADGGVAFQGPLEVKETYMGGKETHKHRSKKLTAGRGAVENAAAVGIKYRHTTP